MHIELDGDVWRILEFQHVKPGKGGAFVRSKLRNLGSGAVVDKTFRAGEKFTRVHTEVKDVQYLYDAGDEVVFMDTETYEQFSLPHAAVEDALPDLEPLGSVQILWVDGRPSGVPAPSCRCRSSSTQATGSGSTRAKGATSLERKPEPSSVRRANRKAASGSKRGASFTIP